MSAAGALRPYKIPESVLVVIHTPDLDVLLLRRADMGTWQSVTGSKDAPDEAYRATAVREVQEETGLLCEAEGHVLVDWQIENCYAIYPAYAHRYAPDVTHNTEHVFSLCVPSRLPVTCHPREHTAFVWLPWQDARHQVFSVTNAKAIEELAARCPRTPRGGKSVQASHG